MKKVQIRSIKDASDQLRLNNNNVILFSTDYERIDKMVAWLFDNTSDRFVLLGTDTIYFENDDAAVHFLMVWG